MDELLATFWAEPEAVGCELLSHGYFSRVYEVPNHPEIVLKVGRTTLDGWIPYALWCMGPGPKPPAALKVHALRVSIYGGFAALTERALCTAEAYYGYPPKRAYTSRFGEARDSIINAMHTEGLTSQFMLDCHARNIMLRHDFSPVVIDPLSEPLGRSQITADRINERVRVSSGSCPQVRLYE